MSFNVKVISTLNDKNDHAFLMFCDLCITWMVCFRLKSFSCSHLIMNSYNSFHDRHIASILGPLHLKYDSKKITLHLWDDFLSCSKGVCVRSGPWLFRKIRNTSCVPSFGDNDRQLTISKAHFFHGGK